MYKLHIHKDVQKELKKTPKIIREKIFQCLTYFREHGIKDCPFSVKPLKGKFKKFKYLEVKISNDYRIFFRIEGNDIFIRKAGTHNKLGTG